MMYEQEAALDEPDVAHTANGPTMTSVCKRFRGTSLECTNQHWEYDTNLRQSVLRVYGFHYFSFIDIQSHNFTGTKDMLNKVLKWNNRL